MLIFKSISFKNFLSFGNVFQKINLKSNELTLILGENRDTVENTTASRNGTGKTAILQAITYALYGQSLAKIKKDNLVNKSNFKNMETIIEFEKDNIEYRIERGRKPNYLKFFVNHKVISEETNDAQGENKETQEVIENILGFSYSLFKQIIALNAYQESILTLGSSEQRILIEELLGLSVITEKSKKLGDMIKDIKNNIKEEEFKLKTIKDTNDKVIQTLNDLQNKSSIWNINHEKNIEKIVSEIDNLLKVDIEKEINLHNKIIEYSTLVNEQRKINDDIERYMRNISSKQNKLIKFYSELKTIKNSKCPTCDQDIHNEKGELLKEKILILIDNEESEILIEENKLNDLKSKVKLVNIITQQTFYPNLQNAYKHKQIMENYETNLNKEINNINPFLDQIESLSKNAIQDYNTNLLIEYKSILEHQEFLYRILTNKDSFVRKQIMKQNLSYLNQRLTYYLSKIGLPHSVKYQSDLNVDIENLGQDFDYDSLSKGERTRLSLSLSFAFRDTFEMLAGNCNLLWLDEADSNTDQSFYDNWIAILKDFVRNHKKSVFLVSHQESIIPRVDNIIMVIKEVGFSNIG